MFGPFKAGTRKKKKWSWTQFWAIGVIGYICECGMNSKVVGEKKKHKEKECKGLIAGF